MVLKLTVYVRNVISFFYKPKTLVKFRYLKLFWQNFGLCFTENRLFWGAVMFMTSLWRHTLDVCTFWYAWKEEIHSYTMVPIIRRILGDKFSSSPGNVNHRPLVNRVTENTVRRELTFSLHNQVNEICYLWLTILNLNCIYIANILIPLPAKLDHVYLFDPCRAKNLTYEYGTVRHW